MAHQHRELHLPLDDAEKLWRYAQSTTSKHKALDDTLVKVRAKSKHWERKDKKGIERATVAENERNEAKEEAQVARLATVAMVDTKARAKSDLARVQDALAISEKAR